MLRASVLVLALAFSAGCDLVKMNWGSDVTFTIDRDRAAAGQVIEVTFEALNDEGDKRYWIAIVPEETPSTDAAGRVPIPKGARTMHLTARTPGANEVRVFTEANGAPNLIVARRKIRVVE